MGLTSIESLDAYPDLSSLPPLRRLQTHGFVECIRKAVPFDHIAVAGLDLEGYHMGQARSADTDLPPAYVDTYVAEKIGWSDPLVSIARSTAAPVTDDDAFKITPPPPRLAYLLNSYEIGSRLLIPVTRPGAIYGAVCFSRRRPFTAAEHDFLATIAAPVHRKITKPLMDRFAAEAYKITSGEIECLKQASMGLTSEAIGELTRYRADTVNTYLNRITHKLGASNRAHAIAEAIRRKLID